MRQPARVTGVLTCCVCAAPSCCGFILCVLTVKRIDSMKAIESYFFAVPGLKRQRRRCADDELEIDILI